MPEPHTLGQPSRVLFMSEAIDIIGTHLTPPDLLRCILVCRAWNILFIPHLYDTLDDSFYAWPEFLDPPRKRHDTAKPATKRARKGPGWILETFTKYGHLIRRLYTNRLLFSDAAAQTCTKLTSLASQEIYLAYPFIEKENPIPWKPTELSTALKRPFDTVDRVWIGAQWLWKLVQQNAQTLQELELHGFVAMADHDSLLDLLGSCRRLTRLKINRSEVPMQSLLERMPQLQHYTYLRYAPPSTAILLTSPMPQLVTLRIQHGITKAVFFSLLTNLPNLQELTTGCRYEDYTRGDGLPRFEIKFTPSRIQRLHFTRCSSDLEKNEHRMLAEILQWIPDLIQIGIPYLDPNTAISIVSNCLRLQSFQQSVRTDTILRRYREAGVANSLGIVLCNSVHLTEFDGVRHEIEARSLVLNPWICEGLVILRLQIIGVTRLTEEEEMDYKQGVLFRRLNKVLSEAETRALEKYEEVREQHQKIYGQLAKLVHLKELELGMEYRDLTMRWKHPLIQRGAQWYRDYGDTFPDTLELSLASGLDQLSTLTKLEVFGFESVDYRIDEEELRWMAEKWPRLRVMRGLHEIEDLPLLMHDGEKWHRRAFMQRLRPDIRHEGRKK
ncbi:hypothetical protein BG015_001042 [Linnemannia schmuckeri]|uniref:F-box domain-containing protein n=1 Tax=Linnemannia schmuckeri TaxID=64567 RepID=A0A9P5RSQ9_9FUNG|nr:hypothetical protein BG015_001042 [Linnemannia schmuckeri]